MKQQDRVAIISLFFIEDDLSGLTSSGSGKLTKLTVVNSKAFLDGLDRLDDGQLDDEDKRRKLLRERPSYHITSTY